VNLEIALIGKQNLEEKMIPHPQDARVRDYRKSLVRPGDQASPKNERGGAKLKRNAGTRAFKFQQGDASEREQNGSGV
jgi:hypothetical protein